jgi:2-oxo-4-hydroxy-4-carboxy--5-ureidoimidazoline (OHCU) decarboxylase
MPPFTALQLKLHIKDHHDLGVNLVSKKPVDVERPTPATLIDRRPATVLYPDTSTTTSSTTTSTTDEATAINITKGSMAEPPAPTTTPSLPPITSLPTAPMKGIISALDLLFEPSKELHTLALPAIQSTRRLVPANPGLSSDLPPPAAAAAAKASIPSPALSDQKPYSSYDELITHVGSLLYALCSTASSDPSKKKLHAILGSHPRLGAKKVESAQSKAEQAQLHSGGEAEAEKLRLLNGEYEARFPGLRYVVFVNGRSRPVIMENMRSRIDRGDFEAEEREAVDAMIDIAKDRARKLQATASE